MVLPSTNLLLPLPDPAATESLARACAAHLPPHQTVFLKGPIGAGKTHFARAFIRARLGAEVEVPSPSFTLVQIYDTPDAPIYHADLYRLSDVSELTELGLFDAFGQAQCLIEWPEKLGHTAPGGALTLALAHEGEGRVAALSGPLPPALVQALRPQAAKA